MLAVYPQTRFICTTSHLPARGSMQIERAYAGVQNLTSSSRNSRMSPPPLELLISSFALGFIFKLVGAWGVHSNNLRWLRFPYV